MAGQERAAAAARGGGPYASTRSADAEGVRGRQRRRDGARVSAGGSGAEAGRSSAGAGALKLLILSRAEERRHAPSWTAVLLLGRAPFNRGHWSGLLKGC